MRRNILAGKDELNSLRNRISRKPFNAIYDMLRKRCAMTLESQPITEAQWRRLSQQGAQAAALTAARTAQGRIMDLLIADAIDPNAAYRDRAAEELRNLISWSTWVDPSHADLTVDLCTAEAAVGAAIGLDWLYDDLTEVERLRVVHALRNRVIAPYRQAVASKAWWYSCYHSWNAVVNSGCGLAALMLADEEPAAFDAYQLAKAGLKHFFDALGREGGWDEGIAYWGYAMRYVLLLGEAAGRTANDHTVFHSRGMDVTGMFGVYFTPNGQYAGFGDAPAVPLYGSLYLLVKHFGVKEVAWWLDTYAFHRDVSSTDWSAAGLAMLFRPDESEAPIVPDLQPVKVFNEIGWAAMADHWPKPSFYVSAKTGDLSAHHSQRDMCSLQLQVDGEMLLSDVGLAPYDVASASEEHGEFLDLQAACHNTLIVGQRDHRIDAQGTIVEAQDNLYYRWLACNAGVACGEDIHHVRHLVMLANPRTAAEIALVVLDEVANAASELIDVFWHSPGAVTPVPGNLANGEIQGQQAKLHYALAATASYGVEVLHRDSGQKRDGILHLSLDATRRAFIVSVFSRLPLERGAEVKRPAGGELRVRAGKTQLVFRSMKKHLQLDRIQS